MSTFAKIAQELRATVRNAADRIHGWDDEYVAVKWRGKQTWSRKEIFGHLIDSASNNHQRFVRANLDGNFSGPGYEQEAWMATGAYQEFNWERLQALWLQYNALLAHVLDRIPEDRVSAPCTIGDSDPVTLQFLAQDYVDHMRHHLDQIFQR